ncbi:unnamed protein product [Laminaria digitata]
MRLQESFSGNPSLENMEQQQQQQPEGHLNTTANYNDAEPTANPLGSNSCRNATTSSNNTTKTNKNKSTRIKTASTTSRRHGRAKKTTNFDDNSNNTAINRGCFCQAKKAINNRGCFGVGLSCDALLSRKDGGCRDCKALSRANLELRQLLNRAGRDSSSFGAS